MKKLILRVRAIKHVLMYMSKLAYIYLNITKCYTNNDFCIEELSQVLDDIENLYDQATLSHDEYIKKMASSFDFKIDDFFAD